MTGPIMFEDLDLRLYAIVDPENAGGRPLPELARMVAAGGATLVQLRDKKNDTRAMIELARAVKAALPGHVPLIINDRVDVALEIGAGGVHLGQEDGNVLEARERLGPGPFIGLTVQTVEHARAAPLAVIDYAGIGGVYVTSSKNNPRPPIGVAGLKRIVDVFRYRIGNFPTCAIAGITKDNTADVIAAGADGVSVISALSHAGDPAAAARALREVIDAALARRAPVVPDTRELFGDKAWEHHHG
jgi:thiamine-phosphate pyrophosphorylase